MQEIHFEKAKIYKVLLLFKYKRSKYPGLLKDEREERYLTELFSIRQKHLSKRSI